MLARAVLLCLIALAMTPSFGLAQSTSPNGVRTLDPPGAIKAEGTWSLGVRAGDFVFVAGMQGVDPATNTLVRDPQARISRAFLNLKLDRRIGGREPTGLRAAHRLCERPAPLRADGGQGAGGALGQAALSAAHHGRGAAAVRRRHR